MEGTIGEIRGFAGNFSPRTWAFCDGQLLSIATNTALFSIIGTTYGGDGRTTFALPDLRGRIPINSGMGPGLSDRRLGQRAGSEENYHTLLNLPNHNHYAQVSGSLQLKVSDADATQSVPTSGSTLATPGTSDGRSFTGTLGYNSEAVNTALSGVVMNNIHPQLGTTGNNTGVNNMAPYLVINWIICMMGVFPSRN